MKIRDILSPRAVVSVFVDDDLAAAARAMLRADIHHLPVLSRDGKLVGLLGEQDILRFRVAPAGRVAPRECVGAAMVQAPVTIGPEDDVAEAARLMATRGATALPIVQHGSVTGMLTTTDLIRAGAWARRGEGSATVADVMRSHPFTAAADEPLLDAIARMAKHGIRHLPVTARDETVIGVLSDRDVRTAVGNPVRALELDHVRLQLQALRVADVMSKHVHSVAARAGLGEAASRLADEHVGALPVVDESGRLLGIVSYVDVLRAAFGPHPGSAG